jgi:Rieske 2Fe-2S family protein
MGLVSLEPSLPSRDYTDPAIYALEQERIFCREWVAACRQEEIPRTGDWRVFDVAGESVLVVRGPDSALRAFYNVCRHRGARLCASADDAQKPGRAVLPNAVLANGAMRCPYHAWTYAPDGALIGAPFLSSDPAFPKQEFSLHPVGCAEWGGFVFLHLTPAHARPLAEQLGAAAERIARYPLHDLRIGHRIRYEVDANWKILCENYNECYHCGPVHPELCALVPAFRSGGSGLDWEDGIPHRDGATTFTWSGTTTRKPFAGLNESERSRHKGELIYPNLFLSLACDHVAAFILQPRGAGRTHIECLFLFAQEEMATPGFDHSDASDFWNTVNQQDWAICERVQQGMSSRVHVQGYYAPMEDANLDMRRYVRERH